MKKAAVALILIGFGGLSFAADESQQPALQYTLELNGQAHGLVLDKPVKLPGDYKNPSVVLKASETRQFTYGNVSFEYPASYTWEAEIESDDEKTWTLSGTDFTFIYFTMPVELSIDSFVKSYGENFDKESTQVSDSVREFGGQKYQGKLLITKVASTNTSTEVYSLAGKSGKTRLILLQDTPSEGKKNSKDGERFLAMFAKSFRDNASGKR